MFGRAFGFGILTFKPALFRFVILLAFQLLVSCAATGQDFKIVFWNLENYFDTRDDVATADDEFTPMGERHWSRKKFNEKRNGIAKTLLLLSCGELPALIGVAEAENRYVLRQLTEATALSLAGYGIIHRDSPDARGIDVGLLYRKERYTPITSDFIYVRLPDTTAKTRLILYSKGVLDKLDTIHVFVNHWPSKYGSGTLSDSRREAAAGALKMYCDSLLYRNSRANILIMGDFNETPDKSAASALAGFTNLAG
ncbi:MAG: endonuclease/exonuclease/phosphatase, partial [uncultured bacterium]